MRPRHNQRAAAFAFAASLGVSPDAVTRALLSLDRAASDAEVLDALADLSGQSRAEVAEALASDAGITVPAETVGADPLLAGDFTAQWEDLEEGGPADPSGWEPLPESDDADDEDDADEVDRRIAEVLGVPPAAVTSPDVET